MSTPLKTYDLASVFLLIGGYQIGGFGEDGAVSFEYGKPVASAKVGGDGQAVVSRNNDYSMTATITVMESSKSYKDLFTLYSAQQEEEAFERLAPSWSCPRRTRRGARASASSRCSSRTPARP